MSAIEPDELASAARIAWELDHLALHSAGQVYRGAQILAGHVRAWATAAEAPQIPPRGSYQPAVDDAPDGHVFECVVGYVDPYAELSSGMAALPGGRGE